MNNILIDTLSWGVIAATYAILDFDIKSLRNIVIGAFILGCIRGYMEKI